MSDIYSSLVYTSDESDNWLYKKYYYSGGNARYWTWQIALGLLAQRKANPIIVETGCQRMADDLGAGMSTSIFGEFCQRHGGHVFTVDLFPQHLAVCKECTKQYSEYIDYIESDSVVWLENATNTKADLLYLDSVDYPIGPHEGDIEMRNLSQTHSLKEFIAAKQSGVVQPSTILLIDDNQLLGGGKPKLLKRMLQKEDWICLLDLQQSLWIRSIC